MEKKWKYLLIILILIIFIIIRGCINFITGGYTDEVYTVFSTGPGFNIDDNTFFPASYRLYRKPEGLRRFPDGGQSKRVFEAVYLIKTNSGSSDAVFEIKDFSLSDSDIKYTRGIREDQKLKLLFSEIGTDNYFIIDCSERKPEAEKAELQALGSAGFTKPELTITETKKIFKKFLRTSASGIPTPLKYTDKTKKQLIQDVVCLCGDFYYRAAVIDALSDSEVAKLPEKMAKYQETLKKGNFEYSIYSKDTKKYIEERLGL